MTERHGWRAAAAAVALCGSSLAAAQAPAASPPADLDARVEAFLEGSRGRWRDLNVPYADGETLRRLVLEGGFRRILEIGTSTGHSTVWLAWAAARTGGRVTTIEIDERRHGIALQNLERAGLSAYVDARLADAHELVRRLEGPFDFVFSDADKGWYLQYFLDLEPKLQPGGCFTAHNVLRPTAPQVTEMVELLESRPGYRTHIERSSPEGILVACKDAR